MSLVWINGRLVDKSEAKISVFDHGFLYGDGAWTHLRAFGGKLFRPEWPLKHLFCTLEFPLSLEIPRSPEELRIAIENTLRANDRSEGYIRVVVTRGAGTLGPDPRKLEPLIIIIAEEYHPFPLELYEHGLHVAGVPVFFDPMKLPYCLGQFHDVWAKREALRCGCLEAILFHGDDAYRGTEGGLFVVKGETIRTVMGAHEPMFEIVSELASESKLELWQGFTTISRAELNEADEAFLSGITCGIIGIVQVDGKPIGTGSEGPVTKRIREAYRKLTRGEA